MEPTEGAIGDWDVARVGRWLQQLSLKRSYEKVFTDADIDGKALNAMAACVAASTAEDDSTWRAISERQIDEFISKAVPSFGDRMKLLLALRTLISPGISDRHRHSKGTSSAHHSQIRREKSVSMGFKRGGINVACDQIDDAIPTYNPLASPDSSYINPAFATQSHSPDDAATNKIVDINASNDAGSTQKQQTDMMRVTNTLWVWREHLQLAAIVLLITCLIEGSMRLYVAGVSAFFYAFPFSLGISALGMTQAWLVWFAIPNNSRHLAFTQFEFRRWAALFVGGLFFTLLFSTGTISPAPFLPASARIIGGFTHLIWHGSLLYFYWRHRKIFRWRSSMFVFGLTLIWSCWEIVVGAGILSGLNWLSERQQKAFWIFTLIFFAVVTLKTMIWDTLWGQMSNSPLRRQGGYLCYIVRIATSLPYWCGTFMGILLEWLAPRTAVTKTIANATAADGTTDVVLYERSQPALMGVLVLWSCLLVVLYLNFRLLARRCLPYARVPILLLTVQLTGDLFTEMVFLDFSISQWEFWFILIFDVVLLVCRDADLWDDISQWLTKRSGWVGTLFLTLMQLLTGHIDTLGDTVDKAARKRSGVQQVNAAAAATHTAAADPDEPTEADRRRQQRELTENCVVSEILTSAILLVLVGTDLVLEQTGAGGEPWVTTDMSQAQRMNAMGVYLIMLGAQVVAICISHRIIRHKNELRDRMLWLKQLRERGAMPKPASAKWHFFLSHMQSTGGDAVHSLCLELEQRGLDVWYDQTSDDLTAGGMREGVRQSDVFVLFLTDGIMSRPFVHVEIREALKQRKRIVILHEADERHHAVDFGKERAAAPDDLKHLFADYESIPFARRSFQREAMLAEMMKRAGLGYEEYFRSLKSTATEATRGRAESCVSVNIAWFDNLKWLRLAIAISVLYGCIASVRNFRGAIGVAGASVVGEVTW